MKKLLLSSAPKLNFGVVLFVKDIVSQKVNHRKIHVSSYRDISNRSTSVITDRIIEKMKLSSSWDDLVNNREVQIEDSVTTALHDKKEVSLFSRTTPDFLDLEGHEGYPRPTHDHLIDQAQDFKTFEFIEDFEHYTDYLCIINDNDFRIHLGVLTVEDEKNYALTNSTGKEIDTCHLLEMITLDDLQHLLPRYEGGSIDSEWTEIDDLPDQTGSLGLIWVAFKDASGDSKIALAMGHLTEIGLVIESENVFDVIERDFIDPISIKGFEVQAIKSFESSKTQ